MVKPEYKMTEKVEAVAMKKPLDEDVNMEDDTASFDEVRPRRRPPVCTFIVLLVLVLLAGFLAVYFVDKWKSSRSRHKESVDIPTPVPALSKCNVSWETQEELFHLSDIIEENHLLGLRPIYRKDLPAKYIAYWEVKLSISAKQKYFIVSAAKQTGDHRLAEEGTLPSPSDLLTEQAQQTGHHCHKVFRLTPDGLMVCEDTQLRRLVASTRNIDSDSGRVEWRKLDRQVSRALPQFARDWNELARRVQKTAEWNRFKWLSMDEDVPASPAPDDQTELLGESEMEVISPSGGIDAEVGLRPGDMVRIPLGSGFTDVRIKFVGFKSRGLDRNRAWRNRWQKRLCRALSGVCEGDSQRVQRNSKFFKQTAAGDRYIRIKVHPDARFVRKQLQGHEVRFQVELSGRQSRAAIAINYGIMLKSYELRRSRSLNHVQYFDVPHEELFPDYSQHHNGHCMTGSGPVAWAMVLGYYDNLARGAPELKLKFTLTSEAVPLPLALNMTKEVERFIDTIHSTLGTHCTHRGAGETQPAKMRRIQKWLKERLHRDWPVVTRAANGHGNSSAAALLVKLLEGGVPVVVSKQTEDALHHYVVATRLRQRSRVFRACDTRRGRCSEWTASTVTEMFVRPGLGGRGNRWENADTRFVSAVLLH